MAAQRIHFDTADWYWRDEGSGHLPVLRTAMPAATAVEATWRTVPVAPLLAPADIDAWYPAPEPPPRD